MVGIDEHFNKWQVCAFFKACEMCACVRFIIHKYSRNSSWVLNIFNFFQIVVLWGIFKILTPNLKFLNITNPVNLIINPTIPVFSKMVITKSSAINIYRSPSVFLDAVGIVEHFAVLGNCFFFFFFF